MTDTVSVVSITGTNSQGGFDRLDVDGTAVRDSICWRGQSLHNELSYRVMQLITPQDPDALKEAVGEAAAHLASRGWTGIAFLLSDGRTVVAR